MSNRVHRSSSLLITISSRHLCERCQEALAPTDSKIHKTCISLTVTVKFYNPTQSHVLTRAGGVMTCPRCSFTHQNATCLKVSHLFVFPSTHVPLTLVGEPETRADLHSGNSGPYSPSESFERWCHYGSQGASVFCLDRAFSYPRLPARSISFHGAPRCCT